MRNRFGKKYYPDGTKGKVNNQEKQDVSGWAEYVGEWKQGVPNGQGNSYDNDDGQVNIGEYENSELIQG